MIDMARESKTLHRRGLKALYSNVCSVGNKWGELVARSWDCDIIILTESWLSDANTIDHLIPKDFVIYRTDRQAGRGGGVLLLVRRQYTQWERPELRICTPAVQVTACTIRNNDRHFNILGVYRAPSSGSEEDQMLINLIGTVCKNGQTPIIVGDFNLPGIDWLLEDEGDSQVEHRFMHCFQNAALHQHVREPTRIRFEQRPAILDLVLTRLESEISELEQEVPLGKSDHNVLLFQTCIVLEKPPRRMFRNYGRIDIAELVQDAQNIKWISDKGITSVDEKCGVLRDQLLKLTDKHAPLQEKGNVRNPPWWKSSVKRAIAQRAHRWSIFTQSGGHDKWLSYKRARNKANKIAKQAKMAYELKIAQQARTNPKRYYSYVQSKAALRQTVGVLQDSEGRLSVSDSEKCETMKRYFEKVYKRDDGRLPAELEMSYSTPQLDDIYVSGDEVLKILQGLKVTKSAGSDGLHPAIIKPLAKVLVSSVTELYGESLGAGKIPQDWRTATVVAIHKGGDRKSPGNYRPVSLTSILCKGLETLVRNRICEHVTRHRLISPTQHGFLKKRSCLSNLLAFLDEVTRRIDEGQRVEVCYLDFRKAFDSVNHRLLIMKLKWFGLPESLLVWIEDFLSFRSYRVRVGEAMSSEGLVFSGVPQGSVLGPILFLLYINDLVKDLSIPAFIFADDVKLVNSGPTERLEADLSKVIKWSQNWDLYLNADKCCVLNTTGQPVQVTMTQGPTEFTRVAQMRDLGILVSEDFKPGVQCRAAARKARGKLFELKATLSTRKAEVFIPLYKAMVRPHLEYCVQAWAPYLKKDIECIERVQRLATRMVSGLRGRNYKERLESLDLFSMERRRIRGDLIETFKIMKGLAGLDAKGLFTRALVDSTRGHALKLSKPRNQLNVRANFFTSRVIDGWNKLPSDLINCQTVADFKGKLDKVWSRLYPEIV